MENANETSTNNRPLPEVPPVDPVSQNVHSENGTVKVILETMPFATERDGEGGFNTYFILPLPVGNGKHHLIMNYLIFAAIGATKSTNICSCDI